LVVAVRQYFRTQFSDVFTSTNAEDHATHCSAIEAALGIDAMQRGVGERFVAALVAIYGNESGFEEFFFGLYVARSLFIHGLPVRDATAQSRESQAFEFFMGTRCKTSLLRALTRDVLRHSLGRTANPCGFRAADSVLPLLRTVLHSDRIWNEMRGLLVQRGAADRICGMSTDQFQAVEELAYRAGNVFDWQCVQSDINRQNVLRAICTCALTIARLTDSQGEIYQASDRLGIAADAADATALEAWVLSDPWRDVWLQQGNRLSAVQILARALARYFEV
jgi:hypothetical protein